MYVIYLWNGTRRVASVQKSQYLISIHVLLRISKDSIHDILILHLMNTSNTRRRGCAYWASNVASSYLVIIQITSRSHDSGVDVSVRSHVPEKEGSDCKMVVDPGLFLRVPCYLLWLLLCPNDLCVLVFRSIVGNLVKDERCNLFETNQSHVTHTTLLTFGEQLVVDLSRAEDKCLCGKKRG
jgi:hypothetical protein